jgi:hypothetical protein
MRVRKEEMKEFTMKDEKKEKRRRVTDKKKRS